jgi:integrase
MFKWAAAEGRIPVDPTVGVTRMAVRSAGYKVWPEEAIACFEAFHPVGTKGRLAFDLLLFTGQRLGDVIRMGPQHVRDGASSRRRPAPRSIFRCIRNSRPAWTRRRAGT